MRTPRIQSRKVAERVGGYKTVPPIPSPSIHDILQQHKPPRENTPSEKLYRIIEDECMWGYRFTDKYCGIPWIELSDIEDKGAGLFIVRFRSPPEFMHRVFFGEMAKDVCERVKSGMHVFCDIKEEQYSEKVKLPYADFVWVIQANELAREVQDREPVIRHC